MDTPGLTRQPTRSEIIELAAAEGHDADIPTNAGSIRPVVSRTSTKPAVVVDKENLDPDNLDKDLEKGVDARSLSSTNESQDSAESDPNIVDFDGPDDPDNPMNWSFKKKWGMILLISAITFLTPLASSMFAPGVPEVMKEFHSTNDMLAGFMVSVYVLGFAFGPLSLSSFCHNETCTADFLSHRPLF